MHFRSSLSLCAILILAVACVPLPQTLPPTATLTPNITPEEITQASATPASQGAAAGWQTYANTDAGFSIQYPPDWSQTTTSSSPPMYGIALDGPQGGMELQWYVGIAGLPPQAGRQYRSAERPCEGDACQGHSFLRCRCVRPRGGVLSPDRTL